MQHVNRRHLFKLAGIGTAVAAAAIGVPTVGRLRSDGDGQLHFRATLGMPQAPLPS